MTVVFQSIKEKGKQRPVGLGACLHERFERQVARTPDAIAVSCEGESLSYSELNQRANWLAHHLHDLGVAPDQLVGLHTDRGIEMVIGILGILKAGGAYLPLDPIYPRDRLAFMLEDSGVEVVVTQESLLPNLEGAKGARVLLSDLPSGPDHNPVGLATAGNLAYAIYTSGSTGKPKGALITHRNVTRLFDSTEPWYHFNDRDVWTLFHSYAFDFSVWELWGALLYGGRVVLIPYWISRSPEDFRELLVRERVTVLNQTPSAFRQLVQAELSQPKADLALRYVIFGGEALELQSLRPWFERYGDEQPLLVNMYGITETTVHVTYRPIRLADLSSGQGSVIGTPIPDLQLYILDIGGEPAPVGVPGEMHVGGAGVSRGYLNRPDLTAQRFIPNPFSTEKGAWLYRTGDLARRLENGDIEYLGRIDNQVKIRGFRIELGEIEAAIATHKAVREVVVTAREDVPGDKQLVAYIVAPDTSADLASELRELLSARLPAYMVPAYFVELPTLPLTENGKVDRKALPAPDRTTHLSNYIAPRTPAEEALASVWAEVLGFERVGIHDNFFRLGGNSLSAIRVIRRMREAGLHIDVRSLFLTPTIAELATAVKSESGDVEVPSNGIPPGCEAITPDMLTLVRLTAEDIARVVAAVPGGASNVQDIYPLSPLQEGMLFHHRMASEGDPYLVTTLFGSASRDLLDRYLQALQLVVDRHDILRTLFLWEGLPEPVQVVCRRAPLVVEELTLDAANGDAAEQLLKRFDPRHYRLDVRDAPIIRIFIAHDSPNARWVMLRVHHHLLEDHTTDELMSEEIHTILENRTHELLPPLPFRNYVAQTRLGTVTDEHEAFFRKMLSDVDEPTAAFGLTDVLGSTPQIEEARRLLDPELAAKLREIALTNRVSAASIFHLAWAKVLSQCSGRDDLVFGTVLFGRMQAGTGAERVLGPMINTLPLRLQLGSASVAEGIRQVHRRMAELLGHEHASLAMAQGCSAVGANVPLFNGLINFRHIQIKGDISGTANHAMAAAVRRMGLELLKFEERTNYPIELSIDDLGGGFMLEAQAKSPVEPRRICDYMHRALEQIVSALENAPATPLQSLSVVPDAERQQVLVNWNATARDYGRQARLHRLIEEQAARTPDAFALEYEGDQLTYAELNRRANQLARLLRRKGVTQDVLVGVFAERSFEMVVALLAILKAGGAYVPLDPSYPPERLAHMLEDAETALVLAQSHLAGQLPPLSENVHVLDVSWSAYGDERAENLDDLGSPGNLAYVIFTSGSTGRPKGAMNEHRGICNRLLWMQEQYGLSADDRVLQKTPFSFDVSVWEFFWPLLAGARLVIARPEGHRDSDYLANIIAESRITTLHFVPSMLRIFLEHEDVEHCTSLKRVICSGEALPHELQERFFARLPQAELHNLYGPTEAAVDVTYWACQQGDEGHSVPIGRPVANTEIYLLDDRMQAVPLGVAGELYIGGVQVGRGYVRRPELTGQRFVPDPFSPSEGARLYKTGDLARYLPDGAIEYLGRADFQVKIRGQRIELGEIEATLDKHAGVGQSVVMAREDTPGDQRLVAYVVPRKPDLSATELKEHLSRELPAYMVPSAFVFLDALPLTSSGKVDRKRLPAPDSTGIEQAAYVAPRTSIEETLVEIWANVLGLERVGILDNFFELGGHSLLAVSVIERMRRAGLNVDVRTLYLMPTIAALAAVSGSESNVVEVPPNRIPLGCESITPDMLTLVDLTPEEIERVVAAVPGGAANIQDIYPLAPLQEGFLFHHALTSQGDLYIMETQFAFDTRERLDRYLEALQWVVDRNDIMRTAYVWEGLREPVQVVCRQTPLMIEELELDPADGDIAQQLSRRYNLLNYRINVSVPPMIRLFIAHDAPNGRWIYHQLTHHLMDDQASVNIQEEEIQAYLRGEADQLPPPQSFRNYVAQAKLGVPLKEHETFFRELLGDVDEPTTTFGLTDVLGNGARIDEARAFVDSNLARRLFEVAQRMGVSTASLFHLAFGQILARLSGRDDVVYATVLLGRMNAGWGADRMLGPCINTMPIRVRVGVDSVQESVRQTQAVLAKILRHEHTPLGLAQRCSGVASNSPLFTSILNYRRPTKGLGRGRHAAKAAGTGAPSKSVNVTEWFSEDMEGREFVGFLERTNYPLTLSIDDFGDGFRLVAQVQAPIDPRRICSYMVTALEQLADALESRSASSVLKLDVLPQAERELLLHGWNDTEVDYPRDKCVHELFEAQVVRTPDTIAIVDEKAQLTYAELNANANRLANHLRTLGVRPGAHVAIGLERSIELVVAQLAILKCGAAYVPLDQNAPMTRREFMIEDCRAGVILTAKGQVVPAVSGVQRLDIDEPLPGEDASENLAAPGSGECTAYVMYTSGSTGQPKGVIIPHRAIARLVLNCGYADFRGDDRVAFAANPAFDASTMEVWAPLLNGGRIVAIDQATVLDPERFKRRLERDAVNVLWLTVALFNQYADTLSDAISRLRYLIVGGDVLDPRVIARVLRNSPPQHLLNGYGPTETTTFAATYEIANVPEGQNSLPIGRSISNTRIYILDRYGKPAPAGVPGEIYIGGAGVARGYLNQPELTAERFVVDPFSAEPGARMYKTGDLGRYLPDGNVEFLGRNDTQVKIRGFRIELGEIEARLAQHPAVRGAVVLALDNGPGDKQLAAYYIAPPDAKAVDAEVLRRHLSSALPAYMVPAVYMRLAAFPLTANGKLDRKALPKPDGVAHAARGYEPPANEVERHVARIWEDVLKLERVGRNDDFFELGGHSLLALRLVGRIETALGSKVGVEVLFRAPTLQAFSACLASGDVHQAEDAWRIVEIQPLGEKTPIIAINNTMIYYNLARKIGLDRRFIGIQLFDPTNPRPLPFRTLNEIAADYVSLIREAQPQGPYVLMGHCVAGLIAYEAAQQLREAGESVPLVIMADSGTGHLPPIHRFLQRWHIRFRNQGHRMRLLRSGREHLTDVLVNPMLIGRLVDVVAKLGLVGDTTAAKANWGNRWFLPHLMKAQERYHPAVSTGNVVVLQSESLSPRIVERWSDFVRGKFSSHQIPGWHDDMFQESPDLIAEHLRPLLEQVDTERCR